jgi:hypothetical protein
MSNSNRRLFLMTVAAGTTALAAAQRLAFAAEPELSVTDPQAVALGYNPDTTKIDSKKYPQHTAAQDCSNCMHFTAQGGTTGKCALFPGKLVQAKGWCAGYAKKA